MRYKNQRKNQRKSYTLKGIFKRHPDGFGFVIPDEKEHEDIYVPFGSTKKALTNDRVEVEVFKKPHGGPKSYYGFISGILKRSREFVLGFYMEEEGELEIKNHNLGGREKILAFNPDKLKLKNGDFVRARLDFGKEKTKSLKAFVVEKLDYHPSSAKGDVSKVMSKLGIPFEFKKEVLEEANSYPSLIKKEAFKDREDLTSLPFVTMDGALAEDFDDAIFVKKIKEGFKLYVAIADVSFYVEEDSLLDEEAFSRGNSSYFPRFCSPMLPESLSSHLCSLKEGELRLALVQEMDFDHKGEFLKGRVYEGIIKSQKRLTYGEAEEIMESSQNLKSLVNEEVFESLKEGKALAQVLIKKHFRNHALNLDIPETLIVLDNQGEVQEILKEQRLFAHMMIEQFMLEANKAVSRFLEKKERVFMYRIHDRPESEKLRNLEKFSQMFGFPSQLKKRSDLIRFLSETKDNEKKDLISKILLRSLAQACYSTENKGHYGLNFSFLHSLHLSNQKIL